MSQEQNNLFRAGDPEIFPEDEIDAIEDKFNHYLKADTVETESLDILLQKCRQIGPSVRSKANRAYLKDLARRIARKIHDISGHYPDATIPKADNTQESIREIVKAQKVDLNRFQPFEISGEAPPEFRKLVGREQLLLELDRVWERHRVNVFVFYALAGTGKTSLLAEWLSQIAQDEYRGAERIFAWTFHEKQAEDDFFLEALAYFDERSPTLIAEKAATVMEMPGKSEAFNHRESKSPINLEKRGEELGRLIGQRRNILILDGLEAIQEPPGPREGSLKDLGMKAMLRRLAAQNQGLCLIATRQPVRELAAFGAKAVRQIPLDPLSDDAGATLLRNMDVYGEQVELEAAVRELSGHALALTLLGKYVRVVYRGDITRRERAKLLDVQAMGVENDGAERLIRRVIRSYEDWFGIKSMPIALLRLFGLFDGPIDWEDLDVLLRSHRVAALTGWPKVISPVEQRNAVTLLSEALLLTKSTGVDRASGRIRQTLDVHPMIREYYHEQLRRTGEEIWKAANGLLFEHFRSQIVSEPESLDDLRLIYAAMAYACKAGRYHDALKIYVDCIQSGDRFLGVRRFGAFSYELRALSWFFAEPFDPMTIINLDRGPDRFRVMISAAYALRAQNRLREAVTLLDKARKIQSRQDEWVMAVANLIEISLLRGDIHGARDFAQRIFSKGQGKVGGKTKGSKNYEYLRKGLVGLASVDHAGHNINGALVKYSEAQGIQEKIGGDQKLLRRIEGYRRAEFQLDLFLEKISSPAYCLLPATAIADRNQVAPLLDELHTLRQQTEQILAWDDADHLKIEVALHRLTLARIALLEVTLGSHSELATAQSQLSQSFDGLVEANHFLVPAYVARASLHRLEGDPLLAHADLELALNIARSGGMNLYLPEIYLELVRCHWAQEKIQEAQDSLRQAREAADRMRGYRRYEREFEILERMLGRANRTVAAIGHT